ncbi:MAG: hypothetical protein QGG84_12480 [Rhodospirillales bacterium]|nr:hypothetical protein [Rhodospirillales bacterium]
MTDKQTATRKYTDPGFAYCPLNVQACQRRESKEHGPEKPEKKPKLPREGRRVS